jgi:hypothetical protein
MKPPEKDAENIVPAGGWNYYEVENTMDIFNSLDNINKSITDGLLSNKWKIRSEYTDYKNSLSLAVYFNFELDNVYLQKEYDIVNKISEELTNGIIETSLVQNLFLKKENEIKVLQDQINTLNNTIKELEPYKTHYDLEFKLKHGKE